MDFESLILSIIFVGIGYFLQSGAKNKKYTLSIEQRVSVAVVSGMFLMFAVIEFVTFLIPGITF